MQWCEKNNIVLDWRCSHQMCSGVWMYANSVNKLLEIFKRKCMSFVLSDRKVNTTIQEETEIKKKYSKKNLATSIIISFLLNFVLLVLVCIYVKVLHNLSDYQSPKVCKNSLGENESRNFMYFSAISPSLQNHTGRGIIKENDKNDVSTRDKYRIEIPLSLVYLVNQIASERIILPRADQFNQKPSVAFRYANTSELRDGELLWENNSRYGATSSAFLYRNDGISIFKTGVYLVYSHLTIKNMGKPNTSTFIHTLNRICHPSVVCTNTNQILLKNKVVQIQSNMNFQTSSVMGTIRLFAGDYLSVFVNDLDVVYRTRMCNYLGIHRIH